MPRGSSRASSRITQGNHGACLRAACKTRRRRHHRPKLGRTLALMDDRYFLQRAVEAGNRQAPPRNFGAVIVKDGEIIAEDCNHVHELTDPTAHAETSAIRVACKKLGTYNLEGCTMYGSHEPCLMLSLIHISEPTRRTP